MVSEAIQEGTKEYQYEIGWHTPIGKFFLEESITHLDRCEGKTTIHPTFAGHVGYADRVNPLIKWIEKNRNVQIELVNAEHLEEQERYDIEDGARVLKKYPKWKTKISQEEIIS